ncbi:ankyrin repeat and SOCS box protein 12-like isoform X2 [Spea bombifrons]|uniref:ankyrin repeat and SOCS box protein 12-like isoform X2 n=1 Tax=Spea bombifrons TaxID=233779 RepID=UPI002349F400|nr:ankyrin repeat and SOCS box protein 12-like isoform X2 [Spea bombifrons]
MLNLKRYEDSGEGHELYIAVSTDRPQYLAELLGQETYKKLIDSRSGWGISVTPLHLAASRGSMECLEILLSHGADVDSLDVKAQTPLFSAVSAGHFNCVKVLLKAGANPRGSLYNNSSPVLMAARDGRTNILRELMDYGAPANVRSKKTILHCTNAAFIGPLYISALYGHLECFKTLLLYGANPDYNCTEVKVIEGMKPSNSVLEFCLKHGCEISFIKLLIDFGANVYLVDTNTNTISWRNDAVELLMKERGNLAPDR